MNYNSYNPKNYENYCKKCGAPLASGITFCSNCGRKVSDKTFFCKKRNPKITTIGILVIAAIGVLCGVFFYGVPNYNYQKACDALANSQFDMAYQMFLDLDEFKDSEVLANETLYLKGNSALEDKRYDDAKQIFANLGKYKDSVTMVSETLYKKADAELRAGRYDSAIQLFSDLENYKNSQDKMIEAKYKKAVSLMDFEDYSLAYDLFLEIGDYKDSKTMVDKCVYSWLDDIIAREDGRAAKNFKSTVTLKDDQRRMVYSKILDKINQHKDIYYWSAGERAETFYTLLQVLPSTLEKTEALTILFLKLSDKNVAFDGEFIRNNKDFLQSVWKVNFIQNFLLSNYYIGAFLEGYWSSYSDRGGHFNFYLDEKDGSTWCENDLPMVEKPRGAAYYDIDDLIWYYDDEEGNHLVKVFKFEFADFNTMKVLCYKNNTPYVLHRK